MRVQNVSDSRVTLPHNDPHALIAALLAVGLEQVEARAPGILRGQDELVRALKAYPGQFVACSYRAVVTDLLPKDVAEIDEKSLLPEARQMLDRMLSPKGCLQRIKDGK